MHQGREPRRSPWEGAEIVHAYTRAQALEDGVLVDVSHMAREAGFRFPVAVTRAVWDILEPGPELEGEGQDVTGRTWDMLIVLRFSIGRGHRTDEVRFAPLFIRESGKQAERVPLWAKVSPGDHGEATITVMRTGED